MDFDDEEHAEKAISELNGTEVQGRRIRVGWSKKSGRDNAGGGGGGASGGGRDCFNCGKPGHMSRECEEPKKPRDSGNGGGGGRDCFNCGKPGHMSKDCEEPKKSGGGGGGGRDCFNCGQSGHMSRECDQPKKPREPRKSRSRSSGRPSE